MKPDLRPMTIWLIGVAGLLFAYFVAFPEDAAAVTSPVGTVLELSKAISPWLYMVIAVAILAWAIVRTWGRAPVAR